MKDRSSEPQAFYTGVRWEPTDPKGADHTAYFEYLEKNEEMTMIKRYILHIEFHWGYCPRISIKRAPRHGDRVVDGGVLGTLQRCPTCQEGFLHEPDPDLIMTSVEETDRGLEVHLQRPKSPREQFIENVLRAGAYLDRPGGSNHESALAIDFNAPMPSDIVEAPRHLNMDRTEPRPDIPKAKISMQPRDDQGLTELLLQKGSLEYMIGEIVWYDHAEHRVVAFEREKRLLLRRLPAV